MAESVPKEAAGLAKRRAAVLASEFLLGRTVVLLGARVAEAFGEIYTHFMLYPGVRLNFVSLPHPSGRCRLWNEPESYERARAVLRAAGVLPQEARARPAGWRPGTVVKGAE